MNIRNKLSYQIIGTGISVVTAALLGVGLRAPSRAASQPPANAYVYRDAEAGTSRPLQTPEETRQKSPRQSPRPIRIVGASGLQATVTGPSFHDTELFRGFEDYHSPRLNRLRKEYELDQVVAGETDEFRRLLKLRHWVHTRWHIDNEQEFDGDAFAILEKAKTGTGFQCSHSMTVQHAVLSAMGYVARDLGVDHDLRDFGRSAHHGVNEVWSNDYAKWIVLDAKYDFHFERDGVPLSALEVHEAVRRDGGRGIVMLQGLDRHRVTEQPTEPQAPSVWNYWWVAYDSHQNPLSQPQRSGPERLVVYDNAAFRASVWQRNQGPAPHWAYAAKAFVRAPRRAEIEWTPGVPDVRLRQVRAAELAVRLRSVTPNFAAWLIRLNDAPPREVTGPQVRWPLKPGKNTLEVRTRNLFGVVGPAVTVVVSNNLRDKQIKRGTSK